MVANQPPPVLWSLSFANILKRPSNVECCPRIASVVSADRVLLAFSYLHLFLQADDSLRATLVMLLSDLPPALPLLLLGTSDLPEEELEPEARGIFGRHM